MTVPRERLHHKKRLRSSLDDARGIGPDAVKALLRHFGSVAKASEATLAELAAAPGVGARSARAVGAGTRGFNQQLGHDDGNAFGNGRRGKKVPTKLSARDANHW